MAQRPDSDATRPTLEYYRRPDLIARPRSDRLTERSKRRSGVIPEHWRSQP